MYERPSFLDPQVPLHEDFEQRFQKSRERVRIPAADAGESKFDKLKNKLAHRKGVTDPGALAAYIGREKYGKAGMAKKAAAGRSKDCSGGMDRRTRMHDALERVIDAKFGKKK